VTLPRDLLPRQGLPANGHQRATWPASHRPLQQCATDHCTGDAPALSRRGRSELPPLNSFCKQWPGGPTGRNRQELQPATSLLYSRHRRATVALRYRSTTTPPRRQQHQQTSAKTLITRRLQLQYKWPDGHQTLNRPSLPLQMTITDWLDLSPPFPPFTLTLCSIPAPLFFFRPIPPFSPFSSSPLFP